MSAVTGQRLDAAVMSNYTGARDARSVASFGQTDEAARICPAYFCCVSNFFSLSLFFFFFFRVQTPLRAGTRSAPPKALSDPPGPTNTTQDSWEETFWEKGRKEDGGASLTAVA